LFWYGADTSIPIDGGDISIGPREPMPPRHEESEVEVIAIEADISHVMNLEFT
jgi:hypothetical protein